MNDVTIDSEKGDVHRLGKVLDMISTLTQEADGIKASLKAQAELIGDIVAFDGDGYMAIITVRNVRKTDWQKIVMDLKVPQEKVDKYMTVTQMRVCSVKKTD
jgi:hypothetical protein